MTPKPAPDGSKIPLAIVAFFAVVIIVNVVILVLALDSHPGVETTAAYEKGRAYNQILALAEDGEQLGWQVSLDIGETKNGHQSLILDALDKHGNPLNNMKINGLIVRPVSAGSDLQIEFEDLGGGRYGATTGFPLPGQWEVHLMISGPDQGKAQFTQRIFIK